MKMLHHWECKACQSRFATIGDTTQDAALKAAEFHKRIMPQCPSFKDATNQITLRYEEEVK